MAEYIEREALIQTFWDDIENGNQLGYGDTEELIRNAPAADVAPVVHGEWIFEKDNGAFPWTTKAICSSCKEIIEWSANLSMNTFRQEFVAKKHYCPNCGAKMDGGKENVQET